MEKDTTHNQRQSAGNGELMEPSQGTLSSAPPSQLFAGPPAQLQDDNENENQLQPEQQGPQAITMERALEVFGQLASLTFENSRGEDTQVPYHFPPDGCYARAHLMAQAMEGMGIASEKVFVMSRKADGSGGLTVPSDYTIAPNENSITWRYHVAPVIRVINDAGETVRMVMDPSVSSTPLTVEAWIGLMSPEEFDERTLDQVQEMTQNNGGDLYPPGEDYYYFSPQEHFWPGDFNATEDSANANMDSVRDTMTQYADLTVATEFIASVRQQLRGNAASIEAILAAAQQIPPDFRARVWANYLPELTGALRGAVSPEDFTRLETFMNP